MSGTVQVVKAVFLFLLGYVLQDLLLPADQYSFFVHLQCCTVYYLLLIYLTFQYASSYTLPKLPKNDLSVVIVGAGFSGIAMAIKLKELGVKFRLIEKEKNLGGTWWLNRYPGLCCDVPSHMYSYSFALNPDWSQSYSPGPEIHRYIDRVADKYNIKDKVELGKKVITATWEHETQMWTLTLDDGEVITANIVVSSVGALHVPSIPKFTGSDSFKGKLFHSAEWPKDYNPKGQRIAVIGTGATSVQIVPSIANVASHVTVLQRTPCWVPSRDEYTYPGWMKLLFKLYPPLMYCVRVFYFWRHETRFWVAFRTNSFLRSWIVQQQTEYMKTVINDPVICDKLTPRFEMGCKRITPSNQYLQSFNRNNVSLVTEGVKCFTETGIETKDGKQHQFDTIIYATGFDLLASQRSVDVYGKNAPTNGNISLSKEWGEQPNAYKGITIPGYPNSFTLLGPGTGLGHNSIIFMIECQINYITEAIQVMVDKKIRSLEVRKEVNDSYQDWVQDCMKNKVFDSPSCFSWYKNKAGVNYTLWPSHLTHYWLTTKNIDLAEYKCVY